MDVLNKLHQAVAAVAPIDGVSIGNINDKATWTVFFKAAATPVQQTAAQAVINTIDLTAPTSEEARISSILTDATVIDLKTALLSATPAQINTYVNNQVIDLPSARTLLKKILLLLAVSLKD